MTSRSEILRYADCVAREFRPRRIILFGSHARGSAGPDSDVDLLVVMQHEGRAREQAVRIRNRVDAPFAIDLLVRSPEQIEERMRLGDCFMDEVLRSGEVLYESAHS